jgi:hypothetical protein
MTDSAYCRRLPWLASRLPRLSKWELAREVRAPPRGYPAPRGVLANRRPAEPAPHAVRGPAWSTLDFAAPDQWLSSGTQAFLDVMPLLTRTTRC